MDVKEPLKKSVDGLVWMSQSVMKLCLSFLLVLFFSYLLLLPTIVFLGDITQDGNMIHEFYCIIFVTTVTYSIYKIKKSLDSL